MKRLTDHLATAATLTLAGYAVLQLVRDIRAIRYVEARLAAPRVLTWSEAVTRMGIGDTQWQGTYTGPLRQQHPGRGR